jgi:hypothetical protein
MRNLIGLLNAWMVSSIESNSCAISEEGMSECMTVSVRKKKTCAAYAGLKEWWGQRFSASLAALTLWRYS